MDVERMESHVVKRLSDNCVDTNATVLQNIRLFMGHVSNVYKGNERCAECRLFCCFAVPGGGLLISCGGGGGGAVCVGRA